MFRIFWQCFLTSILFCEATTYNLISIYQKKKKKSSSSGNNKSELNVTKGC